MCSSLWTAACICLPLSPWLFPCVHIPSERTRWLFFLGFRFSSSTEQSSSRLMRRHRRRRRKPKASNMDRVRAGTQHCRLKSSDFTKFTTVDPLSFPFVLNVITCSLHRSAASQTPPCLWTSSRSLSTWVRDHNLQQLHAEWNVDTCTASHSAWTQHDSLCVFLFSSQRSTTSWASVLWVKATREATEESTSAPSWREELWLQMDA